MAASKKSNLIVSYVVIPVRLEKATDDEDSGGERKVVCIGTPEAPHDATIAKQTMGCQHPDCNIVHSSFWGFPNRGVERDGKMVLIGSDEIAAAEGKPLKDMELKLRDREKVYASTVASDSVQYVTPDRGGEKAYLALRNALAKRPDVVAVTVWAPKSKNALWVLEVVDERIVASKRHWPATVRVSPAIPLAEVSEAEQASFDALIDTKIEDFDMAEFVDQAAAGVRALIDDRAGEAVTMAAPTATVSPTSSGDLLAALQASLDAAQKPAPKPVKKAAAKKAPAKKTAAKKAAGRSAA